VTPEIIAIGSHLCH